MEREISYQWICQIIWKTDVHILSMYFYILYMYFICRHSKAKNRTSPSNSCAKDRKAKEALKAQKADI